MAKNEFVIFKRDSNKISISEFYESFLLGKFNFEPPYQRDYNIWSNEKQEFLIDTIFKNYPMPPIFLDSKVIKRQSKYDVIDGKQRLTSIINFIENRIKLPLNFGNDKYGNEKLSGLFLSDIESLIDDRDEIYNQYLDNFWKYKITVEYIESPNESVVESIFDRLNREGERLSPAELRKASYHNTDFYKMIVEFTKHPFWAQILDNQPNLDKRRLDHYSFISELVFLILEDKIIESSEKQIDILYDKWTEEINQTQIKDTETKFEELSNFILSLEINFKEFKVSGVSHLYALWASVYYCSKEKNEILTSGVFKKSILSFYKSLNSEKVNESINEYKISMQSASKKLSQRKRRVKAMLEYMEIEISI